MAGKALIDRVPDRSALEISLTVIRKIDTDRCTTFLLLTLRLLTFFTGNFRSILASLSGCSAPAASWGKYVGSLSKAVFLKAPWTMIVPGAAVIICVLKV